MRRAWFNTLLVLTWVCTAELSLSQTTHFVTRSGCTLQLDGRPFYFIGANAYYLMEEASRQDTSMVNALFESARQLGMTVVRTWGFFDSPDSLNPSVIQSRPGVFNERALRALDFVLAKAAQHGIHLILPLVNNWDDYGGMNQYVRWRMQEASVGTSDRGARFDRADLETQIAGARGQRYIVALSGSFGHDDFYTDAAIRNWYKTYVAFLLQRVNTFSGIAYRDDPTILAWELANEPRSSDRSGLVVSRWADDLSAYVKQIDGNHLVGMGEEGFDNSTAGYTVPAYDNQIWLFDGTAGAAFSMNSALSDIDFASIHLYPQSWGLTSSTGNRWISDHIRLAAAVGKPLVIGEFGVMTLQSAAYDSWLTTALLEGGGGAMVWQLLEAGRSNTDGYGIRCPESGSVCNVLGNQGARFNSKFTMGELIPPPSFSLFQNYPNPFNNQTTISYDLPTDSHVNLSMFNSLGEIVVSSVGEFQHAGTRKELVEAGSLSSGAYFYRLSVQPIGGRPSSTTRTLVIIK